MFHRMPILLLVMIFMVLMLHSVIPIEAKQQLLSISLMVKSMIIYLLPLIIFGLLFKTAVEMSHRAGVLFGLILLFVCTSNILSTFLSHFVGSWVYQFHLSLVLPKSVDELTPIWVFRLPRLLRNDEAIGWGCILGLLLGRMKPLLAARLATLFDRGVAVLLKQVTYMIPLFVTGFIIKLHHDGIIQLIIKDYAVIFAVVALAQYGYVFMVYFLLNNAKRHETIRHIKSMLPAAITGFGAMSSAAAMPLTLSGVERHAGQPEVAKAVVPATVNIHLVGDCIAIPISAYAVMKSFGMPEPALMNYMVFVFYFVIAKFSVAAIPGGGIIVMLPVLESTLGFTPEMLSLMTALYVLFDPVITAANIFGNGAFAKLIDRVLARRMVSEVKLTA